MALWHERDISHSSVERVILPDACLVLDFALHRMTSVINDLEVDAERMLANLEATGGVVFSQAVLLALVEAGLDRDDAYRMVQRHAAAVAAGGSLHDAIAADPDCPLDAGRLAACFDGEAQLSRASVVFDRLESLTPAD